MTDWDELSPLEIDNQRLRADCAKLETAHRQNMREIDTLRAELAALRENSLAVLTRVRAYRDKVIAERDALRAQLTEACEALEPFVVPRNAAHQGALYNHSTVFEIDGHELTVGNFRRARAVYEKIKGRGDE